MLNLFGLERGFYRFEFTYKLPKISSPTQIVWESHGGVLNKYRSFNVKIFRNLILNTNFKLIH